MSINISIGAPPGYAPMASAHLVVNGRRIGLTEVVPSQMEGLKPFVRVVPHVNSSSDAVTVMKIPVRDLWRVFAQVQVPTSIAGVSERVTATAVNPAPETEPGGACFSWYLDLKSWNRPYTFHAFAAAMHEETTASNEIEVFLKDYRIDISFVWPVGAETLDDAIQQCVPTINDFLLRAAERAVASTKHNDLVTLFHFPTEIRTAAQQYLVYFVDFLRDLGIQASAQVQEQASSTLFSVSPQDGPQALGRVREALNIYLNLPNQKGSTSLTTVSSDIAVSQLQANIFHLQAQMALAAAINQASQATIQAKDAAIGALQLSNYQYQQMIEGDSKRLPAGSTSVDHEVGTQASDTEPVFDRSIRLKKYDGNAIEVDLPDLLRRLKRQILRKKP